MNDNNTYKETETEDELLHIDEINQITKSVPVRRKCKVKRIHTDKTSKSESKETVGLKEIETEQKSTESENQNSQYQPVSPQYLLSEQQNQQYQQYPPQYQQNQPYQQYPPQYQQNQQYQQYPPQYQQYPQPYTTVHYQINQQAPSGLYCEKCGGHNVVIQAVTEGKNRSGCLTVVVFIFSIFLLFIPFIDIIGIVLCIYCLVRFFRKEDETVTYGICQNCGHRFRLE